MIGIGRSKIFYDTVLHLCEKGYRFTHIITDEPNDEYSCSIADFQILASKVGSKLLVGNKVKPEIFESYSQIYNEIAISVNWRYIFPPEIINMFGGNMLNFHLGNLPDYKGNATANWAIINGEKHIYANVHKIVESLDAGDILTRKKIKINAETYISDVLKQAEYVAPKLFVDALYKIKNNSNYILQKGSESGIRCFPRLPQDSVINWYDSAQSIHRLIRASSRPYSGAFTYFKGLKLIVWKAKIMENSPPIYAVPGTLMPVKGNSSCINVATGDGILQVEDISYRNKNGESVNSPAKLTKSIRLRLGNI